MKWIIDQEPENGIMFRGQSTVRVRNKRTGLVGEAEVRYYPTCRLLGPVYEIGAQKDDPWGSGVIDSRPTFE